PEDIGRPRISVKERFDGDRGRREPPRGRRRSRQCGGRDEGGRQNPVNHGAPPCYQGRRKRSVDRLSAARLRGVCRTKESGIPAAGAPPARVRRWPRGCRPEAWDRGGRRSPRLQTEHQFEIVVRRRITGSRAFGERERAPDEELRRIEVALVNENAPEAIERREIVRIDEERLIEAPL